MAKTPGFTEYVDDRDYSDTYISTNYFNAPYNSKMDITSAYAYLKTLPEFKNAEDIFE